MRNIMVCVTKQRTCQRLIDYGSKLRESEEDRLFVIHVAKGDSGVLGSPEEGEALEFLFEKARETGASLTVEKADNVVETLTGIAEENEITDVIAGASGEKEAGRGFLEELERRLEGKAKLTILPAVS